jgi:hypothetical protein
MPGGAGACVQTGRTRRATGRPKERIFWRVKLVATNGEILMVREAYYSRSNAVRAAQRLRELLVAR